MCWAWHAENLPKHNLSLHTSACIASTWTHFKLKQYFGFLLAAMTQVVQQSSAKEGENERSALFPSPRVNQFYVVRCHLLQCVSVFSHHVVCLSKTMPRVRTVWRLWLSDSWIASSCVYWVPDGSHQWLHRLSLTFLCAMGHCRSSHCWEAIKKAQEAICLSRWVIHWVLGLLGVHCHSKTCCCDRMD